jgi:acid stress-induced BolA-like protein IbaG/YrbA
LPTAPGIEEQLKRAISAALPGAVVAVTPGSPGPFSLVVTAEAFAGQGRLPRQKLVYQAIAGLMQGERAPVHAIDSLKTLAPGE